MVSPPPLSLASSYHLGCALEVPVLRIHRTDSRELDTPLSFLCCSGPTISGSYLSVLAAHTCYLRLGLSGAHVTSKPAAVGWQRLLFLLIASKVLLQLEEVECLPKLCTLHSLAPRAFCQSQKDEDARAVNTV